MVADVVAGFLGSNFHTPWLMIVSEKYGLLLCLDSA